jgi:hypothetical protein
LAFARERIRDFQPEEFFLGQARSLKPEQEVPIPVKPHFRSLGPADLSAIDIPFGDASAEPGARRL